MNILVAEDDTTSRLVLAATLKKLGHAVTAVADGVRAWECWQSGSHEVVISDWMMPDLSGVELCRRIRAEHRGTYTYLVLLTAFGGKGHFLEGMEAGADDFVTKPFDEDQLAARLHVAQRILALHDTLRLAAMQDRMTGLWNRAAILEHLEQELGRAARDGSSVGVVLADLDRFKSINDSVGHPAGDAVIREAGRRMTAALRPYDRLGRYGGEEFLLVAPGCGPKEAVRVAERLRAAVAVAPIETPAGAIAVTVSLGVSTSASTAGDATALIAAADIALYAAKDAGRNRVTLG